MYKGSFVALSVMLQADPFLSALPNLIHLAPALIGGGAPTTKNSQRTLQKNAIAGVLLEHGFDIHWTSKAVEQLISPGAYMTIRLVEIFMACPQDSFCISHWLLYFQQFCHLCLAFSIGFWCPSRGTRFGEALGLAI